MDKNDLTGKIEEIEKDIERLRERRKQLVRDNKGLTKYQYRKERTRRLIQTGALAEKYFDIENLSISEREQLFKMFANFIKANKPNYLKK